jgi:hypothetical protein
MAHRSLRWHANEDSDSPPLCVATAWDWDRGLEFVFVFGRQPLRFEALDSTTMFKDVEPQRANWKISRIHCHSGVVYHCSHNIKNSGMVSRLSIRFEICREPYFFAVFVDWLLVQEAFMQNHAPAREGVKNPVEFSVLTLGVL